jgi:hypothetical protein
MKHRPAVAEVTWTQQLLRDPARRAARQKTPFASRNLFPGFYSYFFISKTKSNKSKGCPRISRRKFEPAGLYAPGHSVSLSLSSKVFFLLSTTPASASYSASASPAELINPPLGSTTWARGLLLEIGDPAMVTAVVESPSRQRHRLGGSSLGSDAEFELRHSWRRPPVKRASSSGMRGRWAPPEIEIPDRRRDAARGYTSLRDIMSSPEYAASSPEGAAGDVRTIRHPLVKHAAYAYLTLTPSAQEDARRRRRRRRRGPLCRLLLGCLGFVGALFGR